MNIKLNQNYRLVKINYLSVFCLPILIMVCGCDRSGKLNVEIESCSKQIIVENTETSNAGITTIELQHNGFCYDLIDSFYVTKQYISGKEEVFSTDATPYGNRNFKIENILDDNCTIYIKTYDLSDSAQIITAKVTARYKNQSLSNTAEFSYQTPCKKIITVPTYKLLDTSACETSAGIGDKFLVSFYHQGYCTDEIDSIGGAGDFYSFDGYFWNSADFLIPRERIIFHDNTIFTQQLDFKLCVTYTGSDYVSNKIWIIYKNRSKSNIAPFDIVFDQKLRKKTKASINKNVIE